MRPIVGAITIVAFVAGCGSSPITAPTDPSTVAESTFSSTYTALCEVLQQATDGDLAAAHTTFVDDVHGPLHDLAGDAAEVDRPASARLLEAKERVESGFDTLDPSIVTALEELVARLGTVIVSLGHTEPPACIPGES